MQNTSQDQFYHATCVMPSGEEQSEIVSYLDDCCAHIDALVEKKENLLVELESYKKSLIFEYVTDKKEISEK